MPGDNVIDGQVVSVCSTVLAGEIVPSKNLGFCKFNYRAGALDHPSNPDDGGSGKRFRHSMNGAAPIHYQRGFIGKHKPQGATRCTDIEGFIVSVEN